MTLLTSLLRPSAFDPSLWDNPDVGRRIHHASQCLYERDMDAAQIALEAIPSNLQGELRVLHVGCLSWYYMLQLNIGALLDLYEQERALIDLSTASGAWVGYYVSHALVTKGLQAEALDILAVVEATFRTREELLALGNTLALVGGSLSSLGDSSTAIQYFLYASEVLQEHGTVRQYIRSALNLSFALVVVSRYQDAASFSKRLLQDHKDELEPPELSGLYGIIQRATEYEGNYAESLHWLALHEELAHTHQVGFLVRNLTIDRGVLLTHRQQYAEAYALLSTVNTDDTSELEMSGDLRVRHDFTMGICLHQLGRTQDARTWFTRLTTRQMGDGVSFHILATTLKSVIDYTKDDPEILDPAVNDAYLRLLESRVNEYDTNSSRVLDIHARYAARLAQYRLEREEQLHTTIVESGEQTRREIAIAIHDGAGQELAITGMQLDAALHELPADHPARDFVDKARRRVFDTARELRTLSHALGTRDLERDGLPTAVYNLASDVRSNSHIGVTCVVDESLATIPIDLARSIYRTIQTLVSNTLRHAYAANLDISVTVEPVGIRVCVADDGAGADPTSVEEGMGWRSIRARVELRGGTFEVTTKLSAGTTAVATFGNPSAETARSRS